MSRIADAERMYGIYNRAAPRCPNRYRERSQKPPSFGTCGFESHPRHVRRAADEVRLALFLVEEGFNHSQVARCIGVPRTTIKDWVHRGPPKVREAALDPRALPRVHYAYLLGLYLGDGYICRSGRTYRLRIFMDSRYPGIIEEARLAVAAVLAPNRASIQRFRDKNMVEIHGHSSSLPLVFPQHGAGPKHKRSIRLEDWQEDIVAEHPGLFIRGLIQSDGCRVTNRVWRGRYAYPRYFFSQVSTDIMELFCRTCRRLGVEYRFNGPRSVSIARRSSVALLDQLVGPKT